MYRGQADKSAMNIAMFGQKAAAGSRVGGIEVVVSELSERMAAFGNKVTCYNRSMHHSERRHLDDREDIRCQGVRQKSVPTLNKGGLAAVTSSFFAALYSAFGNYDVVHIHAEGPAAFCWIPRLMGKRVIVTIHGLDHKRAKWGKIASFYIKWGKKNAVRFADEIIVLSADMQQYFKENYRRDTVLIPNGVERPQPKNAELIMKQFDLEKDSYILYLGRIVPEKGISYLIQAFKGVRTRKKLVIAGGSSDSHDFFNQLKALAKEDPRIVFTGFVQGDILKELYSNSYLYCLPSELEGMPLSLLEAMSYGNCCLVSDIPECMEVVEENAVAFKNRNTEDLREKLQYLVAHRDIVEKYKKESSDFVCEKYRWDDVAEKTLELYRGSWNTSEKREQRMMVIQSEHIND